MNLWCERRNKNFKKSPSEEGCAAHNTAAVIEIGKQRNLCGMARRNPRRLVSLLRRKHLACGDVEICSNTLSAVHCNSCTPCIHTTPLLVVDGQCSRYYVKPTQSAVSLPRYNIFFSFLEGDLWRSSQRPFEAAPVPWSNIVAAHSTSSEAHRIQKIISLIHYTVSTAKTLLGDYCGPRTLHPPSGRRQYRLPLRSRAAGSASNPLLYS